jgi:Rha family phage regulatory protein
MVGRRHTDLIRDIRKYVEYLGKSKIASAEFFTESKYVDAQGKERNCYEVTKKGCELIAHKLTGEKGVQFTAAYINRFHEMEAGGSISDLIQKDPIMAMRYSQIQMERRVQAAEQKGDLLETRINTLDGINPDGNTRQKLNGAVRKYAFKEKVLFDKAWGDFKQAFNNAYHTNLGALMNNYASKNSLHKLTIPQYLAATGRLEDGLRVADKMLNRKEMAE